MCPFLSKYDCSFMPSHLEILVVGFSRFSVLWLRKPIVPCPALRAAGELPGEKGDGAGERQPDERGPEEQTEAGEPAAGAQVRAGWLWAAQMSPLVPSLSRSEPLGLDSRPDG